MRETCHRCGEELPAGSGESPFCPHCGTPQLTLSLENQSVETGGDPAPAADGTPSTGKLPPPLPQQVDWQVAIQCAVVVAAVGSVLALGSVRFDMLSAVSFVWMLSAAMVAMALYQRQRPAAWIDAKVGLRIGLMVGLCLSLGLGIALAGLGLVARFGLHTMGSFDTAMAQQIQVAIRNSTTPIPPEMLGMMQSSAFRGVMMLMTFAFTTGILLIISAVGGAFAGMLRTRRGRAA
jgi:hypothetical protein